MLARWIDTPSHRTVLCDHVLREIGIVGAPCIRYNIAWPNHVAVHDVGWHMTNTEAPCSPHPDALSDGTRDMLRGAPNATEHLKECQSHAFNLDA
jgi:hypothetical protein